MFFISCGLAYSQEKQEWNKALDIAKAQQFPLSDSRLSVILKILALDKSSEKHAGFQNVVSSSNLVFIVGEGKRITFSCDPKSILVTKDATNALLENDQKKLSNYLPSLHNPANVKVTMVKFFDGEFMIYQWPKKLSNKP